MKMSVASSVPENRQPREKFTALLIRMCERLDACASFEIRDRDRYLRWAIEANELDPAAASETVFITRMWVVGSYARGMLTCGDLDVLLETRTATGKEPRTHRGLARLAFGHIQNLHWHHGTPETNSSRVAFPEACEVWAPGKDWRAAISAIPVNPQAVRFERPRDLVPLRPHQLYAGIETQEDLLEAYDKGHIAWRFLPYEGEGVLTDLTSLEAHVLNNFGWGEKTRKLVPHAWAYLRTQRRETDKFTAHAGAGLTLAGVHFQFGRPFAPLHMLDGMDISRVVLAPHVSRRGPNGMLEISRGPKHPLTEAAKDLSAWVHLNERGALAMIQRSVFHSWGPYAFAYVLELFSKQELADRWMEQLARDDEFTMPLATHRLTGAELLDAISLADTLAFPSGQSVGTLHLTREGARYHDDVKGDFGAATVEHLIERLQEQARRSQRKRRGSVRKQI
ncbi:MULTISPECIES: hypothetical protein [Steroidobacteraceae]|uniref:hypothetical protein n=1 Tax=Steroidobacteraceae TaxID=2689614 RepID=UPI00101BBD30|nr:MULTISPECIES: hypothetical protein [Steroidobacteraceae]